MKTGKGIWRDFDKKDLIPFKKYDFIGVEDGHTFNLGGDYEVELVWLPGHQPGHTGYLDKAGRILVAGDMMGLSGGSDFFADERHANDRFQGSTIPTEDPRRTVTALRDALEKLSKRIDEFDYVFYGHGPGDIDSGVILNTLETCNEIIANPDDCDLKRGDQHVKFVDGFSPIYYFRNGV